MAHSEADRPRRREATGGFLTADQIPDHTPLLTCRCGGRYLDYPAGQESHRTVFGHSPVEGGR